MKHFTKTGLTTLLTTLGLLTIPFTTPAFASFFHNDWYYSIDPSYDSYGTVNGSVQVGGTIYEIYGMAIKENPETNEIWVSLNSNMPVTGNNTGPVLETDIGNFNIRNDSIAWGDMFFDFSGTGNFQEAFNSGQMLGVRFASNNDSGVTSTGVYRGVTGTNVAGNNAGFQNLYAINQAAKQDGNLGNLDTWMGDYRWNDDYYAPYTSPGDWNVESTLMPNVIQSGERIGDVTIRSQSELEEEGFETDQFFGEGDNIFGFSFQKPLEMAGDFVASILQECINEGMALLGNFTSSDSDTGGDTGDDTGGDTGDDTGGNTGDNTGDGCAATLSQLEALAPDTVDGEWKIFYDALSNQWYDPPAYSGYTFTTTGGTTFTQIKDFPCGISADDSFTVKVGDKDFGPYQPGDSLDFTAFASMGITEFDLIFPWKDPAETDPPFALQLGFNDELGSFKMRPMTDEEIAQHVPEPTTTVGVLLFGLLGLKLRKKSH